jgi:hypothetical protein
MTTGETVQLSIGFHGPLANIVNKMIFKIKSQTQNAPFQPISALGSHFNPRRSAATPPVEMIARLDLD